MKNMAGMNMQQMQQMRQMMGSMPGMNASEGFNNMVSGYNNWVNSMNNAAAPFVKMMTPTTQSKFAAEWSDIANRITVYNIKNAELQYMMYMHGTNVMDKLAENIISKIEKGEEINSMMALYQEWLNISDKVYVNLFESEEYSKLMAEVSSMQLRLRKDIEAQLEKMMVGIPVATRSEMDEMYKTIYDLKKQVRQLEKMMEIDGEEVIEEEKPATARRTTKK
jgi:polyhydroxyalkanoate synthase subunit PhaE